MGFLTDGLARRAARVRNRPELPGWWPLATVVALGAAGVWLVFSSFADPGPQPGARYPVTTASSEPLPGIPSASGSSSEPAATPQPGQSTGPAPSVGAGTLTVKGVPAEVSAILEAVARAQASGDFSAIPQEWPVKASSTPAQPVALDQVQLSKARASKSEDGSVFDLTVRASAPGNPPLDVSVLVQRSGDAWVPLSAIALPAG